MADDTQDKLMDFAEDLGKFLGNTEAKAKSWLNQRSAIREQLTKVRDKADELLNALGDVSMPRLTGRRGRPAKAKNGPSEASGKKRGRRAFTAAQKAEQAKRMKAYWKARKAAEKKAGGAKKK